KDEIDIRNDTRWNSVREFLLKHLDINLEYVDAAVLSHNTLQLSVRIDAGHQHCLSGFFAYPAVPPGGLPAKFDLSIRQSYCHRIQFVPRFVSGKIFSKKLNVIF